MTPQIFSVRIRREEIEALRKTERLASVQLKLWRGFIFE
jgi:hypothetical protein